LNKLPETSVKKRLLKMSAMKKLLVVTGAAVMSTALTASGIEKPVGLRDAAPPQSEVPCAFKGTTEPDQTSKPGVPTNLRIIKGGLEEEDPLNATGSGPFAGDAVFDMFSGAADATTAVEAGPHTYFETLRALSNCAYAYDLRSEASLRVPGLRFSASSPPRLPVIYDAQVDAMVQRIEPGPVFTPGYGGIDAQQLQARIDTPAGVNGVLITWDFMMNEEWISYIGARSDRTWNDASDLHGWKSWRIDAFDGSGNFTLKTQHKSAVQFGDVDSVGTFTMHAQAKMTTCGNAATNECKSAPGASWTEAEILYPRLDDTNSQKYWFKPNRWVRVWMYWGGVIGNGGRQDGVSPAGAVPFYLWYAQEGSSEIFSAYNGTMVNTDEEGFNIFRFEFDASAQGDQPHGLMKVWGRNLVVLHNVTLTDVKSRLQVPVR
jgi:hypothetical protein